MEMLGYHKPASEELIQRMAKEHLGFWPHPVLVMKNRSTGMGVKVILEDAMGLIRHGVTLVGALSSYSETLSQISCLALGSKNDLEQNACPSCFGRGKRPGEIMWTEAECEDCNGHGFVGVKAPNVDSVTPAQEEPKADPWDAFIPDGWEWVHYKLLAGWQLEFLNGRGCVWSEKPGPMAVSLLGEAEAARLHAIVRARNGDWDAVLPSDDWMWEDDGEGGHCMVKAGSPAYVAYDHWGNFARGDDKVERLRKLVALRNEVDPLTETWRNA